MRLECPSCEAQYEVPDNVIPPEGRDVQCSNCGQTWFQSSGSEEATETSVSQEAKTAPTPEAAAISEPEAPADEEPQAPAPRADPAPSSATESREVPPAPRQQTPSQAGEAPEAPARRALDPQVADVLRAEAELEARARRNELAGGLESQPDLGLSMPVAPRKPSPDATAKADVPSRGTAGPIDSAAPSQTAPPQGRERLPDIKRINSSLRATDTNGEPAASTNVPTPDPNRQGTRAGFTLMLLVATALALVYAFAPQIAAQVPEADPWLTRYVNAVDTGRVWLDARVREAMLWLDSVVASSSE